MKKTLAIILIISMLLTSLPMGVLAEEATPVPLSTNEVSVEGNNDLGTMLSETLEETNQAHRLQSASVTDLVINGNTVTVFYSSLEEAVLVVALHSEDGLNLLNSTQTTVSPEEKTANLVFDGDMPDYFIASAYLLDTYDYSPLSSVYKTPMYAQEMQELLASTADDYAPELILKLDDDKSSNFLVAREDTVYVRPQDGVNTVLQADSEQGIYQIGNPNQQFTDLKAGDAVLYPYGENQILIFKVVSARLESDGSVTIAGEKAEIKDVFSHVKIEGSNDTENATMSMEGIDPNIICVDQPRQRSASTRDYTGDATAKGSIGFAIQPIELDEGITISGNLHFALSAKVEWYFSENYQKVGVILTATAGMKLNLERNWSSTGKPMDPIPLELPFAHLKLPVLSGLACVTVVPALTASFTASFEINLPKVEYTFGGYITHDPSGWDAIGISDWDCDTPETNLEGVIFLGFSMTPTVEIIDNYLFAASLKAKSGIEIKMTNQLAEAAESHPCDACFAGEIAFLFDVSTSIEVLQDVVDQELKLLQIRIKFADFYMCDEHQQISWGACPYIHHKITFVTKDANNKPKSGITISLGNTTVRTNDYGIAEVTIPVGWYLVHADFGNQVRQKRFYADKSKKITLSLAEEDDAYPLLDTVGKEPITSGDCYKNFHWALYDNGVLVISGYGDMSDYYYSERPWDSVLPQVKSVVIQEGVTSIGDAAFAINSLHKVTHSIASVTFPTSLKKIGRTAFDGCSQLRAVHLPMGLMTIDNAAFEGCSSLLRISIPDTVTKIGWSVFRNCTSLQGVSLPNGLEAIDDQLFSGCSSLIQLDLPKGITSIGSEAFYKCTELTNIVIPEGVTQIKSFAFANCKKLTNVKLPQGLKYLGRDYDWGGVFNGCTALERITLPEGLTEIWSETFAGCTSLKEVILPEKSLTCIGHLAFLNCPITTIVIPGSVTVIGDEAFMGCNKLSVISFQGNAPTFEGDNPWTFMGVRANAYYPAGNTTWTEEVRQSYGGNITWKAYEPTTRTAGQLLRRDSAIAPVTTQAMKEPRQASSGTVTGDLIKSAFFTGLVPGEEYALLVLATPNADPLLGNNNLLYIDQKTADENGTVNYRYIPRPTEAEMYVVACGASARNLKDARITFPEMKTGLRPKAVEPAVVYNGKTLVEGKDYVITGTVTFFKNGTYTCYIQGIQNYSGVVECAYEVTGTRPGDVSGDGKINIQDVTKLYAHIRGTKVITDPEALERCDASGDGKINLSDVAKLYAYMRNNAAARFSCSSFFAQTG